jgi:alpha-mannosidase
MVGESVRLETMKKADDSDDLILRVYESKGRSTPAQLTLKQECSVDEVNLLEEVQKNLGNVLSLKLPMRPFEIKTLRLKA